jgi:tetratricopeptide (TPR) repeat protein
MKQIFFGVFLIVSTFVWSASAQTAAERHYAKGVKLANAGRYEPALATFRAALGFAAGETPSEAFLARLHFNVGVCLYRLGRSSDAVGELERAIELSRGDYEKAHYALGMAETELKNWARAEKAFRAALRLNEKNGETWLDLAFVYLGARDYEAARGAFRKAIEHGSSDAALARNNLGVILALGGELAQAIREFETALKDSGGKLAVATRNLDFCRQLGQNFDRRLLAKLEFTN